jgi:hypothetical protein
MTVAYSYNSVTREEYERIFPEVLAEGAAPAGLITHAAGEEAGGKWHVIEVWDSDDNRSRWERETLLPKLQKHGVDTSQGPPAWTRVDVVNLVTR